MSIPEPEITLGQVENGSAYLLAIVSAALIQRVSGPDGAKQFMREFLDQCGSEALINVVTVLIQALDVRKLQEFNAVLRELHSEFAATEPVLRRIAEELGDLS